MQSLKYLGINITKNLSKLYDSNYGNIDANIIIDLERWSTYPIGLTHRINTAKMNINQFLDSYGKAKNPGCTIPLFSYPKKKDTLDTWHSIGKKTKKNNKLKRGNELGLLKCFAFDKDFIPGRYDHQFKQWVEKGVTAICTVTQRSAIISFQELKNR